MCRVRTLLDRVNVYDRGIIGMFVIGSAVFKHFFVFDYSFETSVDVVWTERQYIIEPVQFPLSKVVLQQLSDPTRCYNLITQIICQKSFDES